MNGSYRWVAHQRVVEAILKWRAGQRQYVLDQLDTLAGDPFQANDVGLRDDDGRDLQLKIGGSFIITYWVDHAHKEVRILDVEVV